MRASKGKALVDGRLKGLRVKVAPDVSILLPITAHDHFWSGYHEDIDSLAFLARNVPDDGVLFDIGANVGVYLAALHSWKRGRLKLVGFEPIPTTLAFLQQTLVLNGVPARIEPIAVSNAVAELRLTAYPHGWNNFWLKDQQSVHPSISVRSYSLDAWVAEHPELEPDAIKIDVEGHELEVLEGAAQLLARKRPALLIECHGAAWDELGVSRERFGDLIRSAGYTNLRFVNGKPADFLSLRTTTHLLAI
jgi:FkbM family methyltransferase